MGNQPTYTKTRPANTHSTAGDTCTGDELTKKRLAALLRVNAEKAREQSLYRTEREKFEASMLKNPLDSEKAMAYFGLILGTLTPAAIFAKFFIEDGTINGGDLWIVGVMAIINLIAAVVGFFSGKLIGKITRELEKASWSLMLMTAPLIGVFWGIMTGGASGVIIFVIGAFFGAYFGALVGAAALPVFAIFHRLMKKGDLIARNQFLPVAFVISLVISALILGL